VLLTKKFFCHFIRLFFFQVGRFIYIKLCYLRLNGDMGVLPLSLPVDGGFAKLESHSKEDFQKMLTEWQEHLGSLQVLSPKTHVGCRIGMLQDKTNFTLLIFFSFLFFSLYGNNRHVVGNLGSSVGIVIRLWAGKPRNCDSVPGGDKMYFFSRKQSD